MQIRKRLKTIASLVDRGSNVIDVGCDHALLDIYLTRYNSNLCIASDINFNAYNIAVHNIKKYGLENQIQVILSNGFENIPMDKNYTAIICGMGTHTILNILKTEKIKYLDTIIVQTNNDIYSIRKEISKLGYYIQQELVVKERGIYYVILKFVRGKRKYSWRQLYFGPILLDTINNEQKEYFSFQLEQNKKILNQLPKKYYLRIIRLKYINHILKKKLN